MGITTDTLAWWLGPGGFGLCGCGAPAEAVRLLRDYLDILGRDRDEYVAADRRCEVAGDGPTGRALRDERDAVAKRNYVARQEFFGGWPEAAAWWWRYWCDHLGLTTHGGAVSAAWITEKGEWLRLALHELGCDTQDWPTDTTIDLEPEE